VLGTLKKMQSQLTDPVNYQLPISDNLVELNPLFGQKIKLVYSGQIFCLHCQKKTKKSFNQGYCYSCFIKLAQCDLCIMKPETCHYANGTCREPAWAQLFCFQPHIVYLANSSALKVGITRQTQIPTRWIDQGATQALPILQAASRYISGLAEVALAKHVSDKTSWQQMLKSAATELDLKARARQLLSLCEPELTQIRQQFGEQSLVFLADAEVVGINFPVAIYPTKVKSFNLDNTPEVSGVLQGIKGQYLLLDSGVINLRKFAGYEVEFFGDYSAQ
jgi:hypothetical protein